MSRIELGFIPTGRDSVVAELSPQALVAMSRAAEARTTLRREDRVSAAVARLQDLVNQLHAGLREKRCEAMRQGDHIGERLVDAEIDALFDAVDTIARGDP